MRRALPALLLLALAACGERRKEVPPPPEPPPSVRLVATGDVLMHEDVKRSAALHGMASLFSEIAPLFREADLGFANLETPIAPTTGGPGAPYQFNAPAELAPALRAAGFGVLALANNHAFDQGAKSLAETVGNLEAADLRGVGAGRTRGAAEAPLLLDLKGLRVAVFGFTDLFNNNLNRKPEAPWVAAYDASRSPDRIRAARLGSDLVVVSLHWGNEDHHTPSARQREIAGQLVAAGADLILGHHPHVLQPVERVKAEGREGVVAFSLGNCISNQNRMYRHERQPLSNGDERDGVALCVTFRKGAPLEVAAEPLWTENNWVERQRRTGLGPEIRVVPVNRALETARNELRKGEAQPDIEPKALTVLKAKVALLEARQERIRGILGLPST